LGHNNWRSLSNLMDVDVEGYLYMNPLNGEPIYSARKQYWIFNQRQRARFDWE